MLTDVVFNNSAPLRTVAAKVGVNSSTYAATFTQEDAIISVKVDRVGEEGKFFGFGISQKLTLELLDANKEINIPMEAELEVYINDCNNFPLFYSTEITRDETSGKLTVVAYDVLEKATSLTIENVYLPTFGVGMYARTIATQLGLTGYKALSHNELFTNTYLSGANVDGTETYREVLNAIAEATQTIYYVNNDRELVFKALDFDGGAAFTISKELYFELSSEPVVELGGLVSATELGDNVGYIQFEDKATQYVRNNAFWELREDVAVLVEEALDRVLGATITPFSCDWRGDFRTEPGDKIALEDKSGNIFYSYLINDTLVYNGGLSQSTSWSYVDDGGDANNPTTLGEKLKQTYARVDKANKNIELLVSETEATNAAMATLQLDTQSINAAVQKLEETMEINNEGVIEGMAQLTSRVDAAITAKDLTIAIKTELDNGVNKVLTSTGYTLDSDGLKISKSGTALNTQITENGMEVKNGDTAVLTANNVGVDAANLHATTYLIIGNNSRLEDYDTNRTGCFWIGG